MDQRQLRLLSSTRSTHQRLVTRTRAQVERFITDQWLAMESWRGTEMERFKNRTIPTVLAAERQIASLTDVYLATMNTIATGTVTRRAPLELESVSGAVLRNGVEPTVVYSRPEATVNETLARGSSLSVAVSEGLRRALTLSMTDLQLAKTHTVAKRGTGKWFRRVLNGPKNCTKCVIASTQRYHRGNLLPIHPGCDCGVLEEQTQDPGQVINPQLLEATHDAVEDFTGDYDRSTRYVFLDGKKFPMRDGSTDASDYTDLLLIREHGEYGPTLTWRDDSFTSLADLRTT